MTNLNALPAPGNVLEGLSKLGSAIVGLSAFAYIAGLVKLTAMYKAINAEWVTDFLVAQDIMRAGLGPLAMVGVVGAATIYIYSSRSWVYIKLFTLLFVSLALLCVNFIPLDVDSQSWFKSYKFSQLISNSLYMVSGVVVASSVLEIVINKRFNKLIAFSVLIGALCSLYITPVYLGRVWADSVLTGEAALGKAAGEQFNSGSCYLLSNVNSKYLIGCISSGRVSRVQMVEVDKDVSFELEDRELPKIKSSKN